MVLVDDGIIVNSIFSPGLVVCIREKSVARDNVVFQQSLEILLTSGAEKECIDCRG